MARAAPSARTVLGMCLQRMLRLVRSPRVLDTVHAALLLYSVPVAGGVGCAFQ